MNSGINNFSEIGKLNKVLLHRLGSEIEGLVPDNFERLLFDDIPYLRVAQREHDIFADVLRENNVQSERAKKIAAAKNGSKEAIEELALEEIDAYSNINNRARNEDLFSIVETSFIPFGMETELYKVLGIIDSVECHTNSVLGEKIYLMKIIVNDVPMDICVNAANLSGEPLRGRRFRGILWLQGRVED